MILSPSPVFFPCSLSRLRLAGHAPRSELWGNAPDFPIASAPPFLILCQHFHKFTLQTQISRSEGHCRVLVVAPKARERMTDKVSKANFSKPLFFQWKMAECARPFPDLPAFYSLILNPLSSESCSHSRCSAVCPRAGKLERVGSDAFIRDTVTGVFWLCEKKSLK